MSATVGELVVNLVARTAAFNQGLRESQQRVATFSQGVTSAANSVWQTARSFLPVATAAGAVALSIRKIGQTLNALDDLGDAATKLGILPQELLALQLAADKAGTSTETMISAIGKLEKNLGQAAATGKGVTATLRDLGLNAKELAAGGPAEAMIAIAKALEKITNAADGARIKMELFGKAGLDAGAALKELEAARANVKYWDLGSPTAVAAGATYENIRAQAGYAARSYAEHISAVIVHGTRILGAGITRGIEGHHQGPEGGFGHGMEGMQNEFQRIVEEIVDSMRPAMAGPTTAAQRLAYRMAKFADMDAARQAAEATWGQRMAQEAAAAAQAVRDRQQHIAQVIRGQLSAGGDGAQLAPLATMGSLDAYQAMARRGLQPTTARTEEQILETARQQLAEEKRLNDKVAELVGKLTGTEMVEIR